MSWPKFGQIFMTTKQFWLSGKLCWWSHTLFQTVTKLLLVLTVAAFLPFSNNEQFVKSVCIWRLSSLHFPAFKLNTGRFGISLRTQSKYGKIRTRKSPDTDIFYAVKPTPVKKISKNCKISLKTLLLLKFIGVQFLPLLNYIRVYLFSQSSWR